VVKNEKKADNMRKELQRDSRFMLFGSRSKGRWTHESDWDFSAQYSSELVGELRASGFSVRDSGVLRYHDTLTVAILTYVDFTSYEHIHVVLHSDEELFRRTWKAITTPAYHTHIYKQSPKFSSISERDRKNYVINYMNCAYQYIKKNPTAQIGENDC
jgi:predicted nucleotidyltransferase